MKKLTNEHSNISISDIIAIALCCVSFWVNNIYALYSNFDLGWLVRTGQYIQQFGFPTKTPFEWTNLNHPYVAYQWLFEIAVSTLFNVGSLWLVGLIATILSGMLIFFALPSMWMSRKIPLFFPFTLLALAQTPHWFNARPQLVSYFFLLAVLQILESNRNKPHSKSIFLIPFLFFLWCNIHTFWMLGIVILATYAVCDCWRKKVILKSKNMTILILSSLTLFLNPYGANLLGYSWSFLDGSQYLRISELLPSFSLETAGISFVLAIAWILVVKEKNHIPIEGFLLFGFATVLAILMRRFEPVAVIIGWTFLAIAVEQMEWTRFTFHEFPPYSKGSKLSLLVIALSFSVFSWFGNCPSEGAAWAAYTQDAKPLLELIDQNRSQQSRLFHDPTIGSWLIGLKKIPVFIDTRFDAYPKNFVASAIRCLEGRDLSILETYKVNQILTRDDVGLGHLMLFSPDWRLVLHDGTYGWWSHKSISASSEDIFPDGKILKSDLPPSIKKATIESRSAKYLILSRLSLRSGDKQQAAHFARCGLTLIPDSKALHIQLRACN